MRLSTHITFAGLSMLLTAVVFAEKEDELTKSCSALALEMQANKISLGHISLERDLKGYLRFVSEHANPSGKLLTAQQAEARVRGMLADKDSNMFRAGARENVRLEVYEGAEAELISKTHSAISSNVRERSTDPATWDVVQKEIDRVLSALSDTTYAPKMSDSDRAYFDLRMRDFTLAHALIQLRLTRHVNYFDCVRRAFRDLYFSETLRARPELKWLSNMYQATRGDYQRRLAFLNPPYDEERP